VNQFLNITPAEDHICIPIAEQVLIYTDPFDSDIHSEIM
jgi:hypothetical protein